MSDGGSELVVGLRGVTSEALQRLAIVDRVEACEGTLEMTGPDEAPSVRIRLPAVLAALAG